MDSSGGWGSGDDRTPGSPVVKIRAEISGNPFMMKKGQEKE
jgi:hypothetical protein